MARGASKRRRAIPSLVELGLTELEATIYCFLLESGPATGYQVAKEIGKAVANAYKALYSMEEKGAILVEDGDPRRCRAVAPDELLARLEREFEARRRLAADELARVETAPEGDTTYRLTSASQVVERAITMLGTAQSHVVLDAFPAQLDVLRPHAERAAARGVGVLVLAYEPTRVAGARTVLHPSCSEILPHWPGEILVLAVDGVEALQALLEHGGDGVVHATWSANTHTACNAWLAGVNNVALSDVLDAVDRGSSTTTLKRRLAKYEAFRLRRTRGFELLADAAARRIDEVAR